MRNSYHLQHRRSTEKKQSVFGYGLEALKFIYLTEDSNVYCQTVSGFVVVQPGESAA